MKVEIKTIPKTIILSIVFFVGFLSVQTIAASSISGTVYDSRNNSLTDVNVELLNDFYQTIQRSLTDSSGRYEFGGLADGRYNVRVLPFRYDFLEQTQQVQITTISVRGAGQGNTLEILDFYLQPRKGSIEEVEASVIFAQEVPKEAKKLFEAANKNFTNKKPDEAINELKEAIKIFPNYFLALNRLGKEYVQRQMFAEAYQVLIKAAQINDKSPTAFYFLGYSLYRLNYNNAALIALSQAHTLSPASVAVLMMLGIVERLEGKYSDAEKHLTQAKKLSKTSIADLHFELAQLYAKNLKKYKEAADELELFLKAKPDAKDAELIKKLIIEFRQKAKNQPGS